MTKFFLYETVKEYVQIVFHCKEHDFIDVKRTVGTLKGDSYKLTYHLLRWACE